MKKDTIHSCEELGKAIRDLRRSQGVTQAQLAGLSNTGVRFISDLENGKDIVAQYRVRNIPTVVFIKGGEVVDKVVGATSKDTLKSKIDAML